ncbi:MAG TPA: cytochrome o ubiquinol oxidase subunit III [Candidatus Saccharimonadales bacterium]|nr:cytochrome o ubiquinol oxidase subunit III [Candidatus Saccharimonadales bacterium]
MSESAVRAQERREADEKSLFGFWAYIMTDCILFASLFATYAVLHRNTFGGPDGRSLFDLHNVLIETLCLLTSSFTCGLAMLAARQRNRRQTIAWLLVTFALGAAFLVIELTEFHHLVETGNSWRRSGFLSAFFTLVGTHGAHISVGLTWMAAMMIKIWRAGLGRHTQRRLQMLSLFWHFLDIVWIFIFTIVYLLGVAAP